MIGFTFPTVLDEESTQCFADFAAKLETEPITISMSGKDYTLTAVDAAEIRAYCQKMDELNQEFPAETRYKTIDERWNKWNTRRMRLFNQHSALLLIAAQAIGVPRARDENQNVKKPAKEKRKPPGSQEELPRIIASQPGLISYPLDKPNSNIWNFLAAADPNGQLKLDIVTSKKGSKRDAIVYYGISFDELETGLRITKQLTPFDKRVYIAAAALFNGRNDTISATQIYKMMGNSGKPKKEQLQKINDSLTKMGAARVYLDNTQEVQVNKKYTHFKYDASLLPFERISAYINGQLVDSAIHLFREPPLITFARERGQITSLTRQLLESPISKTDANLQLEDYLLERIGHMKNPKSKAPRKMLYATIYERCGIKSRMQRSRAPEKIRRYLDHYKKCGWIQGYTEAADGVTIEL